MAEYQNQYGAVPASKDPIQKEMETIGDTTGVGVGVGGGAAAGGGGDSTQIMAEDYDRTTSTDTGAAGEGENHHHHNHNHKKGIMQKIKEKLPGTGHGTTPHHNN
ncbi:hypothetical protein CR513_38478, partial [Mucuna pruriens]